MNIDQILEQEIPGSAEVFRLMRNHPMLRHRLIILDNDGSGNDLDHALNMLRQVLHGQQPMTSLPRANRTIFMATGKVFGFRAVLPETISARPPEDGLLEMLLAYTTASQLPGSKLNTLPFDAPRAQELYLTIGALREDLRIKLRHTSVQGQQLSLLENEAYQMVKQPYEILRKLAQADHTLAEQLGPVEAYFYGSATKGVETRKDNERTLDKLTQKAKDKGMAEATRKAQDSVSEQMRIFVNELSRLQPEHPPDEARSTQR